MPLSELLAPGQTLDTLLAGVRPCILDPSPGPRRRTPYPRGSVGEERWRVHRYVATRSVGRQLLRSEFVHHIDEDMTNYDPANLRIVRAGAHTRAHLQRYPTVRFCAGCGTPFAPGCPMPRIYRYCCPCCYHTSRRKGRLPTRPAALRTREQDKALAAALFGPS